MKKLPWILVASRLVLTPIIVLLAYYDYLGWPYLIVLALAALSDVYDGKIARKYKVDSAGLRQFDSIADTIFFMGVLAGMIIAFPEVVSRNWWGIAGVLGLEVIRYIFDYFKFKRGASYHAYSAKTFGVFLLTATILLMGFGITDYFLPAALIVGIISELEGLLMSFILPEWTYDVKHFGVALKIRLSQQ